MKYDIIYADPPWEYKESGSIKNSRWMAKQHYQTMNLDDICKLPIKDIKTDQAICFMWATFPRIKEALQVMESWWFIYKTVAFTWVKKNKKSWTNFWWMWAYTRANAEICLIWISKWTKATQIVKSHWVHSIIESPIEKHSKKPDIVRDKIVELLWDLPRIELFAREKIEWWESWGNEVDSNIYLDNLK